MKGKAFRVQRLREMRIRLDHLKGRKKKTNRAELDKQITDLEDRIKLMESER